MGGTVPSQGVWGCAPTIPNKGRVANPCNPATSGAQNAGGPSAHGGGQRGVQGAKPSGKGYGGCPFTPTKVSLFEKGRPSPTITKAGVEGAQPPPRGHGGCAPKILKKGQVANSCTPAKSGAQNAGGPSAHGGGQRGVQGAKPPWQGVWGMCPQKPKLGNGWPTLAHPPRVGPKTLANPQPTRVGKGGPRGEALWRGAWGVPPAKPN